MQEYYRIKNLLTKINDNGSLFIDYNKSGHIYDYKLQEMLIQETDNYKIKILQKNQLEKVICVNFYDKNNEELFKIVQKPKSFSPAWEIVGKNFEQLDYKIQEKIIAETTDILSNLEVYFDDQVTKRKNKIKQQHQDKINSIYNFFNTKEFEHKGYPLDNSKTYKHGVDYLIQYFYEKAPGYLFKENNTKNLVYVVNSSYGEIEIDFGSSYLNRSQKFINMKFLDKDKNPVFIINGRKSTFLGENRFESRLSVQNTIIDGYEQNLILASIPTEKIINEIINQITKDIYSFEEEKKKNNDQLLNNISNLKQQNTTTNNKDSIKEESEVSDQNKDVEKSSVKEKIKSKNLILEIRDRFFYRNKQNQNKY